MTSNVTDTTTVGPRTAADQETARIVVPEDRKSVLLECLSQRVGALAPPHIIAFVLVLAAGVISLAPPSDPDVWWHVRTGDLILETRRLPGVDPWSLVAEGNRWIAHEWLAQVVIALFYKAAGLFGLSVYRAICVTALIAALASQAFRRTTPYRALGCTVLAFFATMGGWGERPQLISFLLLIVVAQFVRSVVASRRNPWWLVPITWLWANLHGLWLLSVALIGVAVLGMLLQRTWRDHLEQAARLTTVAFCCLVAAAATPNGPQLLLAPLHVRKYAQFVSEWNAPSVHSTFGFAFFAIVISIFILFGRRASPADGYAMTQVIFAFLFGLLYIRTVAPAAVLLIPLLADAFGRPRPMPRIQHAPDWLNSLLLGSLTLGAATGAVIVLIVLPRIPPGAPVEATKVLVAEAASPGGVINEYGIGGWLIGRAPSLRPAIDGRTEIYTPEYVAGYLNALSMSGDWRQTILPLDAKGALLQPTTPLVNGLRDELGWSTVYADDNWVVLIPPRYG